jgi:uncharacterized membrane protein
MEQDSIDIVSLFSFSFAQYKKYASFIIGAVLTYLVLAILPQIYFMFNAPDPPTTKAQFISFALTLVQVFLSLGFTKIMFLLIQDKHVEVADMFNNFGTFLSYFVATFLYGIGVTIGLFLLVAPGLFIAIRFQFYPYFILEENVNSFTALKKSYYLSQNLTIELFLLGIIMIALNVAGALTFGIGIIFTYPLTTMATALVYKSLTEGEKTIPSDQYRM